MAASVWTYLFRAPQLSDGKQKDFKELLIQKNIDASFNSSPGNSNKKTR